jgi:hypothetical protein
MAIKTFTTGEVLTAADTNTYLANSGLVYIKSQTIGSGVSSVTVSSAFDSTYDNYKIIVSGGTASGNFVTRLTLGATATGYYYAGAYCTFAGAVSGSSGANVTSWLVTAHNANNVVADVNVFQPNLAKNTSYAANYFGPGTGDGAFAVQGWLNDTTAYTAFTLTASGGTYTGGTITVYGYRKA